MKYPFIQQQGEEDCGAACLASIAKHHGLKLSQRRIRDLVGTGHTGTNLWGLQQGAEKLGFSTRPVKAAPDVINRITEVPLPAIIHWKGNHWVVLYGKRGRQFVVVDPAVGVRYLSAQELADGWMDWVMLLLERNADAASPDVADEAPKGSLGRMAQRVWVYRSLLSQVFIINVVVGLLSLASPLLLQVFTDDVLVRGDLQMLNTVAIAVMITLTVSTALELIQSHLVAHFAQRLELSFILEFCKQILRLPLDYYERHRSGEIVSRVQDIQQINYLISQVLVNLPSQSFVAIISLGLMLFYSYKLTLLAVGVAIAMTISVVVFQPTLKRKTQAALVADADNQGVLVETFKGALTLKTLGAFPQFWGELQSRFSHLATLNLRINQIGIINNSFSGLVSQIGGIALLWFGGSLVVSASDQFTIGQLLAFKALNDNFLGLINTVIGFVDELTRVKASTERLEEVTQVQPEGSEDAAKQTARIPSDASILFDQVNFDYPGRANLLDQFSVHIPGGQVTALIGQSGCGKSTLAKLMAGLYSSYHGNIRIGAYNQHDLSLENLRQQIVLVPQESHFWSRTILENFRVGTPDATFEQIVEACQIVGADEFISNLPNKYQTVLGEFATNLSGGQRQRLAIARALISNPPILILDESTSGLDPRSEAELMDRLLQHRQGKTTILISHRPAIVERADWVVVLEQGRLKQQGSRTSMLTNVGAHLETLYTPDHSDSAPSA